MARKHWLYFLLVNLFLFFSGETTAFFSPGERNLSPFSHVVMIERKKGQTGSRQERLFSPGLFIKPNNFSPLFVLQLEVVSKWTRGQAW